MICAIWLKGDAYLGYYWLFVHILHILDYFLTLFWCICIFWCIHVHRYLTMCHDVFPYLTEAKRTHKPGTHIMLSEKITLLCTVEIPSRIGAIQSTWAEKLQRQLTRSGSMNRRTDESEDSSQVTMMKHCLRKEAAAEFWEAVQAFLEDGISGSASNADVRNPDDWTVTVRGQQGPLCAHRWFQDG